MKRPMTKRTRVMLLVGLAIFAIGGGGAAYLSTRSPDAPPAVSQKVAVLSAVGAIDPGTSGAIVLNDGRVIITALDPADVPAGAVTDATQIASGVAASAIPAGTTIIGGMFTAPQTRIGTVVIPPGRRALAVELAAVPGVAGFAGLGDRIDIYGVVKDGPTPGVKLVQQSVEVLNVNGAGLATAQGQPGSPNLIYLLAVTPQEAERLIYLASFEKLYFDLVPKGEPPVVTPGVGAAQAIQVG